MRFVSFACSFTWCGQQRTCQRAGVPETTESAAGFVARARERTLFPNALLRDRAFLPCKSFVLGAGQPVVGGAADASPPT
jgi:hypothetical protein